MKVKPNFFIVGAAKSGTTSLYNYLYQHPDIYFSPVKEPNFFSDDIDVSKFTTTYRRNTFLNVDQYFAGETLKKLPLTFVRKPEYYNRLFEHGNNFKLKGEASTSYLYSKSAAKNIFNFNPEAKIIAILRNPVERAFSHYQMAVRYGHTKLVFRDALEKDFKQIEKGWGISELFFELGLYYDQLKRYFEIFPSHQIKIFLFNDLKSDPQKLVDECCEFFNLESFRLKDKSVHNVKEDPGNIQVNYFLTRTGFKNALKKVLPESTQKNLSKKFYKRSVKNINQDDYNYFLDWYREDIKKTASLINMNLDYWLQFKR